MTVSRITIVNHVSSTITCAASAVWREILEGTAEGQNYLRLGYQLERLDDPAAHLGSNRLRLQHPDGVSEIEYRITERDDAAMRLSVRAEFLGAEAKNIVTYATYHAVPLDACTLYRIDCHSTLDHALEYGLSTREVAASVDAVRDYYDAGLRERLAILKSKLEEVK